MGLKGQTSISDLEVFRVLDELELDGRAVTSTYACLVDDGLDLNATGGATSAECERDAEDGRLTSVVRDQSAT